MGAHSWLAVGLLCVGMLAVARLRATANEQGSSARKSRAVREGGTAQRLLGKLIGDRRACTVVQTGQEMQASLAAAAYAAQKVAGQQLPLAAAFFEKVR